MLNKIKKLIAYTVAIIILGFCDAAAIPMIISTDFIPLFFIMILVGAIILINIFILIHYLKCYNFIKKESQPDAD